MGPTPPNQARNCNCFLCFHAIRVVLILINLPIYVSDQFHRPLSLCTCWQCSMTHLSRLSTIMVQGLLLIFRHIPCIFPKNKGSKATGLMLNLCRIISNCSRTHYNQKSSLKHLNCSQKRKNSYFGDCKQNFDRHYHRNFYISVKNSLRKCKHQATENSSIIIDLH